MKKLICAVLAATAINIQADTLVNCPTLITGEKGVVLNNKTVRIRDTQIIEILDGSVSGGPSDQTIALADATCMPGLIDAHVHITSQQSPTRYLDRFTRDTADVAFAAIPYARRTLMAGFTTVRDLGSSNNLAINMRNAINAGHIDGPRIFAAGKSLATTGGHADPTNGTSQKLRGDPGPKDGVLNSAADARKAVRQRYKDGADLIKITATGGVLSQAKSGQNSQFTGEELKAVIAIAKDYGFKVAAHAHGTDGMKRAVIAGVDSIEHGTHMDIATMKLMRKKGTAYVPTIIAGKFVAEMAEIDGYFSEAVRLKARAIGPQIQSTFAKAYKQGVPIVFGTDSGVSPHGDNWKEFTYMVEAGMPELAALNSAMLPAAELLDAESIGAIKAGNLADLIAVAGDPLTNISQMKHVQLVIKDGTVFRLEQSTSH